MDWTRREAGALVAGAILSATQASAQTTSGAASPGTVAGPALDIADWSYHFYGAEGAALARGTVPSGGQMYVERWIPAEVRHPYPVILVYGGFRQGEQWISTPDGRRGWATLLLEQGFKVYVIDRPGQGRNPFHPWVHGPFSGNGPNFEGAARNIVATAVHTQWPGQGDPTEYAVEQSVAGQGQPMPNNTATRSLWSSRGAMLVDDIGPATFLTHGDGAVFAWLTAQARPALVKGIAAVEPNADSLSSLTPAQLRTFAPIPIAVITAEDSRANTTDPVTVAALRQAGSKVEHILLVEHGVRGNGTLMMMEKNNREALQPIVDWFGTAVDPAQAVISAGVDPSRNRESTAVKLADQGCFWVGVQRKSMPFGTIPVGQMFVQYAAPSVATHPYPVVLVHGGGGQSTYMMGILGRPGWAHYFLQDGYAIYCVDRTSYGRSPYQPNSLGPSHLPSVQTYESMVDDPAAFATAQWPGSAGLDDPAVNQFMAGESGNVTDEAFHSELVWHGGVELLDKIGPSILVTHGAGAFAGWGLADRRPDLVKAIVCVEGAGNPFAGQLRWGLTAAPVTYDPPVEDPAQFALVDATPPPGAPLPAAPSYKLQAAPARQWKNLRGIPIGWLTSEHGGGGSAAAQVAFLQQVGCQAEMLRLRDHGIDGNGHFMMLEKNNHEVFGVIRDWLRQNIAPRG